MSQVIHIFPDGSAALVETDESSHTLKISGQAPSQTLPATADNLKRYFPDLEPGTIVLQ